MMLRDNQCAETEKLEVMKNLWVPSRRPLLNYVERLQRWLSEFSAQ